MDNPVLVSFLVLCLCPGALLSGGFAFGWFLRGRGGLPRLYWPQADKFDSDIDNAYNDDH